MGQNRTVNIFACKSSFFRNYPNLSFLWGQITQVIYYKKIKQDIVPFSIYNVADDLPSSLNDLIEYICSELNISVPLKINNQNENKKSFFSESKKIDNSLIKKELDIDLKYTTYFEGYKKIIESMN